MEIGEFPTTLSGNLQFRIPVRVRCRKQQPERYYPMRDARMGAPRVDSELLEIPTLAPAIAVGLYLS